MNTQAAKLIFALLLIAGTATYVFAVPDSTTVHDVRYTVHNLSNNTDINAGMTGEGRNYVASGAGATEVCVFCHTPHNAAPAIPLWNKVYTPGVESSYRLYTSSATLSSVAKGAQITADSPSLLCLSCHDGKTAINVLHNSSYRDSTSNGNAVIDIDGTFSGSGPFSLGQQWMNPLSVNAPNLGAIRDSSGHIPTLAASTDGTNLTDDHPIGFSYTNARNSSPGKQGSLKATPDTGIRLFGPGNDRIECSSCHNPHIYYGSGLSGSTRINYDTDLSTPLVVTATQKARTPFLNKSNSGSGLCLGCHIK